jgi:2'-5' RNA ligase
MYRLFTAIHFPDPVKERIADLCFGVREARWLPIEQIHLTLRFIGEVNKHAFDDIREALDTIATDPFTLSCKGVGFFPLRGNPRVLWVGIEPAPKLQALYGMLERCLEQIGVEREHQKFHPHLTVARFKQQIPVSEVMPFVAANSLFRAGPVAVDAFHLYSSVLRPEGPIHTLEESYPLDR